MCGIAGFVDKTIKNKKKVIKDMAERIKYRGPDGEGYFIDDEVALAHRRLAIIDLSSGGQPQYNEDNSLVIVFNGEIYNFVELKSESASSTSIIGFNFSFVTSEEAGKSTTIPTRFCELKGTNTRPPTIGVKSGE